ncbi:MAG: hypothetical protein PWR10_347 [Halanaerobiales bacterium]|nr:hypothetical protein [Halanaerobiales bacterium]
MENYFADLHIHIGAGEKGEPVKITASRQLNFANILEESAGRKGLDMVGIIDCASPVVIRDIENLLARGEMVELPEGGIKYHDHLVVILGAEVESREENGGQAHYLAYFPHLEELKEFSDIMKQYITNINLSSQSTGLNGGQILQIVDSTGGILVPAHAFTPHKSFYGRSFTSYREVFSAEEWKKIPAIELGLSADTELADYLAELRDKTFISNSDAHSLGKIAREYNQLRMEKLNFKEFKLALEGKAGREVVSNYGLDPRLGKYHRSYCLQCEESFPLNSPVYTCPLCGKEDLIIGVKDRILKIADRDKSESPEGRPPYIHQVPLTDVPGVGSKTLKLLLENFGTEMNILHRVEIDELKSIVNPRVAENIARARSGKAEIKPGGGGIYGKVMG